MKNNYSNYSTPLCLLSLSFSLFLLPSHHSTFGYLLQELLLLPQTSCTTPSPLSSLTSISFLTFSLLFVFCFPMSHPTFQSLFQSNFLYLDFLDPSFEPLQLLLVIRSVLQPPAHMSSSLFPDPGLVSVVWYFSHTAGPSLLIPLIDAMSTSHSGDIRTGATDVLGPFQAYWL